MTLPSSLTYAEPARYGREFDHVVLTARMVRIALPAYLGDEVVLVVGTTTTEALNRDQCAIAEAGTLAWPGVRLFSPKARAILTVDPATIALLTDPEGALDAPGR